ncbi:hypothetical protein GOV07_04725 [Candidatus Woesearchaeota archaeon]|nr:hypothetical protein [Candidatus Woesearchaeota archaeon]
MNISLDDKTRTLARQLFNPKKREAVQEAMEELFMFPKVGETASGRRNTVFLGKQLQEIIEEGDVSRFAEEATRYVIHGFNAFSEEDVDNAEYNRIRDIVTTLYSAFTQKLREPHKQEMLLEHLPKVTHSLLVGHQGMKARLPIGWRETGIAVHILHDTLEDTLYDLLPDIQQIYRGQEHEQVVQRTWIAINLLTRSMLGYVLYSQQLLGLLPASIDINGKNMPVTLEDRLFTAIVKQGDRYVNNRSIEPFMEEHKENGNKVFSFDKVVKEFGKSLWIADYVGKNLLIETNNDVLSNNGLALKSALNLAVKDNLRSLYSSIRWVRREVEKRLATQVGSKEAKFIAERLRANVNQYGQDKRFFGVDVPRMRITRATHEDALDGTLVNIFTLMYPRVREIKDEAAKQGVPDYEIKRQILDGSPAWLLPTRYQRGNATPSKINNTYDQIMKQQKRYTKLLGRDEVHNGKPVPKEKREWQLLTMYALEDAVALHLLLDEKYHPLSPAIGKNAHIFINGDSP